MKKPFRLFLYFLMLNVVAFIVLMWLVLIVTCSSMNNDMGLSRKVPNIEVNTITK